jgi:hypothetical protein
MQPSHLIVTILLTAVIVAAIIFATAASLFPARAEAHAFSGAHGGWGMHRAGGHHGGATGDHCARLDMPITKLAAVMIDDHLDLSDNQRALLTPALDIAESWQNLTRTQCERLTGSDMATGLDALEQTLRLSADSVAQLRPAYAAFHDSLDESQRKHIIDALQHRGHRKE